MSRISKLAALSLRLSLGAGLAGAALAYAFHLMGGDIKSLVQPSMAMIVGGGPLALLTSTRSLQRLANGALAAGVIGVVMGLVHVMTHLDKPDVVGIGIAVALVAMLYALILAYLMGNVGGSGSEAKVPDLAPYALMAVSFLLLLTFAVLYAIRQ